MKGLRRWLRNWDSRLGSGYSYWKPIMKNFVLNFSVWQLSGLTTAKSDSCQIRQLTVKPNSCQSEKFRARFHPLCIQLKYMKLNWGFISQKKTPYFNSNLQIIEPGVATGGPSAPQRILKIWEARSPPQLFCENFENVVGNLECPKGRIVKGRILVKRRWYKAAHQHLLNFRALAL